MSNELPPLWRQEPPWQYEGSIYVRPAGRGWVLGGTDDLSTYAELADILREGQYWARIEVLPIQTRHLPPK